MADDEITNDRLDAIRARLAAATPGPWRALTADALDADEDGGIVVAELGALDIHGRNVYSVLAPLWPGGTGPPADADLIARAPDDLAWLVGEVERLRAECCAPCPILRQSNAVASYWRERWDRATRIVRRQFRALREHTAEVDARQGERIYYTMRERDDERARAERAERERAVAVQALHDLADGDDIVQCLAARQAALTYECDATAPCVACRARTRVERAERGRDAARDAKREAERLELVALADLDETLAERDAAREEVARLRDVQADLLRCPERAMEVTRERDAAAARIARLEKALREIETHDPDAIVPACECATYTDCLRETRDRARHVLARESEVTCDR